MDLAAAERMAAIADPKSVTALQKRSDDPAVAKAVAGQFGTLLMQRVMQNGDGQAIAMAGNGVGGNIVSNMFASTMAQTAMSGDKLGLADLLFRSIEAKQQSASSGGDATASGTITAAARPPAVPAAVTAAAAPGLPLSPYWQGNGLRPLGSGAASHNAPAASASAHPVGPGRGIPLPSRNAGGMMVLASAPARSADDLAPAAAAPLAPGLAASFAGSGAGATIATGGGGATSEQIEAFSRRLEPLLQDAARQLGVSPRVLLAQAALETGWGRSVVGNNIFGIKAGASWSGPQISAPTHEIENGRSVPQIASFRSYGSLDAAVQDFVSLVGGSSRYRAALGRGDDAKAYAAALIGGGYATDGDYPNKLAAVAASVPAAAAATASAAPNPVVPRFGFFDLGI